MIRTDCLIDGARTLQMADLSPFPPPGLNPQDVAVRERLG